MHSASEAWIPPRWSAVAVRQAALCDGSRRARVSTCELGRSLLQGSRTPRSSQTSPHLTASPPDSWQYRIRRSWADASGHEPYAAVPWTCGTHGHLDRLAGSTTMANERISQLQDRGVNIKSLTEPDIDTTTPMGRASCGPSPILAREAVTLVSGPVEAGEGDCVVGLLVGRHLLGVDDDGLRHSPAGVVDLHPVGLGGGLAEHGEQLVHGVSLAWA